MRPLELMPTGQAEEGTFLLRDPQGYAQPAVVPLGAAMLITLMNGQRSLAEIQSEFSQQAAHQVPLADVERLVEQLDQGYFLESIRFEAHRATIVDDFVQSKTRPAAHAGGAYAAEPEALRTQFRECFVAPGGPDADNKTDLECGIAPGRLCGLLSPHIDFHRGGPAFAWAYKQILDASDADLFIVLGTAHSPMKQLFSVLRKDFETPLGTVSTDTDFIEQLAAEFERRAGTSSSQALFADDIAHRQEHSIEFQAVFLKYILEGKQEFSIVPILVGSFNPFVSEHRPPNQSQLVTTFTAALRDTVASSGRRVCFISGGDLAHIGQQFGDAELVDDERLTAQRCDDNELLRRACAHDAAGFFDHVAQQRDQNRICGLSPTYMMLETMTPSRGSLLKYDQAVSPDRTNCVTFASVAFYTT